MQIPRIQFPAFLHRHHKALARDICATLLRPRTTLAPFKNKERAAERRALRSSPDKPWNKTPHSPAPGIEDRTSTLLSPCASLPSHRSPSASQAGTRILYWVRGNYRVHDNLALSAAMWLSTKLRMPLQASASERDNLGICSYNHSGRKCNRLAFVLLRGNVVIRTK